MNDQLLSIAAVILAVIVVTAGFKLSAFRRAGLYFFKRKVGPTYWGVYRGASSAEAPADQKIDLPQPLHSADPPSGGKKTTGVRR